VATVGLTITIPLAIASDYFIDNKMPDQLSLIGAAVVVLGFVTVNIDNGSAATTPSTESERSLAVPTDYQQTLIEQLTISVNAAISVGEDSS